VLDQSLRQRVADRTAHLLGKCNGRARLTVSAAAQLMRLERRPVFRLLKVYRAEGAAGLVWKRRGRPSNRRKAAAQRRDALALIRERYWDLGRPWRRRS
jgi:hypothetical protein